MTRAVPEARWRVASSLSAIVSESAGRCHLSRSPTDDGRGRSRRDREGEGRQGSRVSRRSGVDRRELRSCFLYRDVSRDDTRLHFAHVDELRKVESPGSTRTSVVRSSPATPNEAKIAVSVEKIGYVVRNGMVNIPAVSFERQLRAKVPDGHLRNRRGKTTHSRLGFHQALLSIARTTVPGPGFCH